MSALPTPRTNENERQHERFALAPMYTTVTIQRVSDLKLESLEGHAYDLSESGVRIELDVALDPGERVAIQLGLPGEDVDIYASAQVIWIHTAEDDPGPRRAALMFHDFLSDKDRSRLIKFLGSGLCRRAA